LISSADSEGAGENVLDIGGLAIGKGFKSAGEVVGATPIFLCCLFLSYEISSSQQFYLGVEETRHGLSPRCLRGALILRH
jgi:hypothetical protein